MSALLIGTMLISLPRAWAARSATVTIDGAMVYKDSSFDAPVIAYLKKGKQVVVSNKTYGPFFKVKLRPGLIGFISDIDVKVETAGAGGGDDEDEGYGSGDSGGSGDEGGDDVSDIVSESDEKKPSRRSGRRSNSRSRKGPPKRDYDQPIFASRFLGAGAGMVNFKEEVLQQKPSANVTVFGLKLTGPNILFEGPYIFDINAVFSFSPPSFYETLTDTGTKASGFFTLIDVNLLFPIATGYNQDWMAYIGGGPLGVYSKFQITHSGQALDLQELKLGGSFVGGAAYRIGGFMVKVDAKYYVEKASYFGVLGGVQKQF